MAICGPHAITDPDMDNGLELDIDIGLEIDLDLIIYYFMALTLQSALALDRGWW